MFEIIIQFLIGVLTPIIFIGGIIAVLNELIQSFEKKEEYNRKLEELEEEIKEFSSQNQTLVEDCKSTIICTEDQLISFNRSLFFYRGIFLYFGSSIVNLFSNKFKNYVKCGHSAANK